MIVRREGNGLLFITQPAHAWLAGELVASWGNQAFAAPSPFEAIVLATRLHDIGWLEWDASPRLENDGRPVNFLDTTLDETIPLWRRAVRQMSLFDPYAALLVSQHASTVYRRRQERGADPPEQYSEVGAMLAEQEAVQEAIRAQLADHPLYGPAVQPDRLYAAYRWLRVCDLFSLVLCSDALPRSGVIEAVPGLREGELTSIHYERHEPFHLALNPSPLAKPLIKLSIQARFSAENSFRDEAEYQAFLNIAPWITQTVTVTAG